VISQSFSKATFSREEQSILNRGASIWIRRGFLQAPFASEACSLLNFEKALVGVKFCLTFYLFWYKNETKKLPKVIEY